MHLLSCRGSLLITTLTEWKHIEGPAGSTLSWSGSLSLVSQQPRRTCAAFGCNLRRFSGAAVRPLRFLSQFASPDSRGDRRKQRWSWYWWSGSGPGSGSGSVWYWSSSGTRTDAWSCWMETRPTEVSLRRFGIFWKVQTACTPVYCLSFCPRPSDCF